MDHFFVVVEIEHLWPLVSCVALVTSDLTKVKLKQYLSDLFFGSTGGQTSLVTKTFLTHHRPEPDTMAQVCRSYFYILHTQSNMSIPESFVFTGCTSHHVLVHSGATLCGTGSLKNCPLHLSEPNYLEPRRYHRTVITAITPCDQTTLIRFCGYYYNYCYFSSGLVMRAAAKQN